jgi:hypothetical protein
MVGVGRREHVAVVQATATVRQAQCVPLVQLTLEPKDAIVIPEKTSLEAAIAKTHKGATLVTAGWMVQTVPQEIPFVWRAEDLLAVSHNVQINVLNSRST